MKVGILGAGFMGSTHARAYTKLPDVKIVAVSSRTIDIAEKLAGEVDARATTDPMSIIGDPSIDIISNTLPTYLHPQFTIAALEAGKHVLLEKPFGLTVADCDKVIEAHRKSGKTLMVAHVLRFWPEYVALVGLVHSGKIGKPLSAVASRLSAPPGWADWFQDPAMSGGAVLDLIAHDLDALNWIFGQPISVYARGQATKPGLWNHIHAEVDYGSAQGMVEGSWLMPKDYPFTCMIRVLCEGGSAEFNHQAGGASVEISGRSSLVVYEAGRAYKPEVKSGDDYELQIAYFVDCVRNGRTPTIGTPEQARLTVQLSNATRASLESGAVIRLEH